MERRNFIKTLSALPLLSPDIKVGESNFPISANTYNWVTFYKRQGRIWGKNLENDIAEFVKSGLNAIEPNIESVAMAKDFIKILPKHGLSMPSIYVNSLIHEEAKVKESITLILDIAKTLKSFGTKIIVTNPSPIKWGGPENKNDSQLKTQALAMEKLGAELSKLNIKLAYHTHDIELRAGAKEFHHILQNTSAKNVHFCFDLHWVYRGSENSELAVFDILKMYKNRIVELHIRQSKSGIWQETFTAEGDINYNKIAKAFEGNLPHLVIEQCIEADSPNTVDAITAHIQDLKIVKQTFKKL